MHFPQCLIKARFFKATVDTHEHGMRGFLHQCVCFLIILGDRAVRLLGWAALLWEQALRPGPRLFIMGSHIPHIFMPFQNADARTVLLQAVPGPAWTRDSSTATSLSNHKMGSHYTVTRLWSHGNGFKWVGATQPSRSKSTQPHQVVAPEVTGTELVSVTGEVSACDREMLGSPWTLMLVTFIPGLPVLTKKTEQTSLWARLEKCLWYMMFPTGWKWFCHGIWQEECRHS